MNCNIRWLCTVDVINVKDGINLGRIDDICFDTDNAKVICFVIFGKKKFFGIFGRYPDLIIQWADIQSFGQDVMLVNTKVPENYKKPNTFLKIY